MSPLEQKVQELEEKLKALEECANPAFVEAVYRFASRQDVSNKTAASATTTVSEAGTDTYDVATPPSGFISLNGFNIPYYN